MARPVRMERGFRSRKPYASPCLHGFRQRPSNRASRARAHGQVLLESHRQGARHHCNTADEPQPLSLNELTLRLELVKSSVFRILHTLEVSGYVERDLAGRYTLSADLQASAPGQLRAALVDAAMPALKELSREFRETVSLAMRFENRIEVIGTVESPHLIHMGNTVGRIVPPHASSLGKAVAAFQREEVRDRLVRSYGIHRFTEHTVTDEVELKREFERVHARGYSTDAGGKRSRGLLLRYPDP